MSYQSHRTDHRVTREVDLVSTQGLVEEGVGLVHRMEDGVSKAIVPASGDNTDVFLGFAFNERRAPLTSRDVHNFKVPASAPYTITLPRDPVGAVGIRNSDTQAAIAVGSASNAGEFAISGRVITFNAAQAGQNVAINYGYAPTAMESIGLGDGSPSNVASGITQVTQSTGCIFHGRVVTDKYNPVDNWAAWNGAAVKIGANGIVTLSGNGATIPNARITSIPEAGNGYLGIEF